MDLPPDLKLTTLVLGSLITAIGAGVQGTVGFGLALFAAPLVTLLDPRLVPGPMLLAGFVLTVLMAAREHTAVDFSGVKWALLGRVPGVVAGALIVAWLPVSSLEVLFGVLVILAVMMTMSGLELSPRRSTLLVAGLFSGFMGTAASIGGPPVALVYNRSSGPEVRGTLSGYFLVGVVMSIVALAAVGRFGKTELVLSLALLPGIVIGFVISARGARWLDQRRSRVRAAVLLVSLGSGLLVIVRQLVR